MHVRRNHVSQRLKIGTVQCIRMFEKGKRCALPRKYRKRGWYFFWKQFFGLGLHWLFRLISNAFLFCRYNVYFYHSHHIHLAHFS